uniref:Uncharacterized protein n=1 Tax=Solanum tuberosum TaxID=4113 RepID=M1DX57_SOLTU
MFLKVVTLSQASSVMQEFLLDNAILATTINGVELSPRMEIFCVVLFVFLLGPDVLNCSAETGLYNLAKYYSDVIVIGRHGTASWNFSAMRRLRRIDPFLQGSAHWNKRRTTFGLSISSKLREKVRKYSDKCKAVQLQNHFAEPIGKARNYFSGSPSAVHREYKGAYNGRTISLSASRRMLLVINGFTLKVT